MPRIAIIGGSGLYQLFRHTQRRDVTTPYGLASPIFLGEVGGRKVAFMNRHTAPGSDTPSHDLPPHMINFRANIWALRSLGVERIIATNAVGSLRSDVAPGTLGLVTQFIDFTKGRALSFYDGITRVEVPGVFRAKSRVVHVDMTEPFCPVLRETILEASRRLGVEMVDGLTYACMEGPRFETPAEIRALRLLGADVVGMTLVPEVVLARELNMCYSSIAIVTNYAAGMQSRVTHREVVEILDRVGGTLRSLLSEAVKLIPEERRCGCAGSVEEA